MDDFPRRSESRRGLFNNPQMCYALARRFSFEALETQYCRLLPRDKPHLIIFDDNVALWAIRIVVDETDIFVNAVQPFLQWLLDLAMRGIGSKGIYARAEYVFLRGMNQQPDSLKKRDRS